MEGEKVLTVRPMRARPPVASMPPIWLNVLNQPSSSGA
jgi:hypothetical protein